MSTLTIKLSERGPVEIDTDHWSVVVEKRVQPDAFAVGVLSVRKHADGRVLVYGVNGHKGGGFLLTPAEATPEGIARAVRRAAGSIGLGGAANLIIGSLPAEKI